MPCSLIVAQERPHAAPDLDVDARRRLVEDQEPRLVDQRARDHEAALHAAGKRARDLVALVPELQLAQVFLRALDRELARNAVEARLVHDDREHLLELVEVDFLRHEADAGLRAVELAVDVVAEDGDAAAALLDERHDDADGRRLAGAVRPEQREEIALGDVEVDAAQRLHAIRVGLGQVRGSRAPA